MKNNTMIAAASALACLSTSPLAAQEIEADDTVSIQRKVVVIDTDEGAREVGREVRVMRIGEGARNTRGRTGRDAGLNDRIDAMKKVEARIVKMGEGANLSEAELRAITGDRIADGRMVVFSGEEMQCELQNTGEVKLRLCTSEGQVSALDALRKARRSLAADTDLDRESRGRALTALDDRIDELEAATGR